MVNIEVFQKVNKKDVSFIKETIASILGSKFIILHRIINYNLNPSILTGLTNVSLIEDPRVVGPDRKSNKIKKAEQINSKTNNIEVIDEKEFIQFISK